MSDPTLVLIHGYPLDDTIWDDVMEALNDHGVHAHAPDLSEFVGATMEDYAREVLATLDHHGDDKIIPVGHSMGGYITFALHRFAPDRLAGAVLLSTRAGADSEEGKKTRETNAQRVLKEGAGFIAEAMPAKLLAPGSNVGLDQILEEVIRPKDPKAVAAQLRAMAKRPDSTAQLAKMDFPVLIVHGKKDQIIPPDEAKAMAAACPHAKIAWCESSGHMPMMEEPERVARILEGFAQQLASA